MLTPWHTKASKTIRKNKVLEEMEGLWFIGRGRPSAFQQVSTLPNYLDKGGN